MSIAPIGKIHIDPRHGRSAECRAEFVHCSGIQCATCSIQALHGGKHVLPLAPREQRTVKHKIFAELVAAATAVLGIERHARSAQRVDVAVNRAL